MLYIARQPIFDAGREPRAYELLFRDSVENRYSAADPNLSSKRVMDTAVLFGLEGLSDGHMLFLNATEELLIERYPTLFPPEITVVEVLETVAPTSEVIAACKQLKQSGYRLALDDFIEQPGYGPLIELTDFIKVDVRATSGDERARLVEGYRREGREMLAEKVETEEEFASAVQQGFTLFQGFFFSKPTMLSTRKFDGLDTNHVRILRVLQSSQLDYVEVEELIKSDPALCYRLLRFLNSPAFYFQTEIKSILHALALLGEAEIRKWLLLVCAVVASRAHRPYLLVAALVRARFAELLGPNLKLNGSTFFILGLVSMMDAILDMPIDAVIEQVALPAPLRAALLGEQNKWRSGLDLLIAYDAGNWERCDEMRRTLCLGSSTMASAYLQASKWARLASQI